MVASALPVTDEQRMDLGRVAGSSVLPHRQVLQARASLWAADGVANEEIARRSRVGSDRVRRWRMRFTDKGVDGVGGIAKGRGRKSWLPPGTVQRVVGLTLTGEPPGGVTHWTTRTLAAQVGVGKDTVAQIWADHRLQPWRVDASTGTLTPNPYLEGHRDEIIERVPRGGETLHQIKSETDH